MTQDEHRVVADLGLANNGITYAQTYGRMDAAFKAALRALVERGVVLSVTHPMHGFGLMPAYKLA